MHANRTPAAVVAGRVVGVWLLCCAMGCGLMKLDKELKTLDTIVYFTGRVTLEGDAAGPSFVVVYTTDEGKEQPIATDLLLEGGGVYHILALPGKYRLLAFHDINRSGNYEAGEPFVILPDPPKDARENPSAELRGNLTIPAKTPGPADLPDIFGDRFARLLAHLTRRNGEVVTLDDERFSDANVRRGVYEPLKFLEHAGPAIFFLQPYDPHKIPVIFVHGMYGSPRSWRKVLASLDTRRFQPWVYYWPTGQSVGFSGWVLDQAIENLRWRHGFDEYHLVAYSMGGLVARTALNISAMDGRPIGCQQFVTFATPWGGDPASEMGVKMSPVVVPAWRDMVPSGVFLRGLFAQTWPETVALTLFFTYGRPGGNTRLNDDGVVSMQSMLLPEAQERASFIYGFDETHESILESNAAIEKLNVVLSKQVAPTTRAIQRVPTKGP